MADEVVLRDGTSAMVWPLLATDRAGLREGYEHLSAEAQYNRFLSGVPHLTDHMLHLLVDEVDGVNHIALVLIALPEGTAEQPVGVARMVRYDDRPWAADVAVTVADDWQRRGVASALMTCLARRRPAGVRQVITQVAADNPAPLALLRHLGQVVATPDGPGVLDVVVTLDDPPEASAPTAR